DSNAVKKASVTNDNHLAKKKKATVRQAEQPPKTSWLKLGLIAIAIALIVAGIILQAGKRDSKKVISDNLKTSVVKKMPKSRPEEFPEAITKSASSKNVVQAKPSDSGSSGLEGTKIDSDETIKDIGQQSSPRTETAISLEAIPDHEQKVVPYVLDSETKISQLSEKSGADAKSIKLFYPYSVKLVSVRTHAEAEKYLALYRQKGLSAYWVKVDLGAQGIWYRIFAGYFGDIGQAQAIIKTHKLDEAVVKQTKFAVLVGTYASEADVNAQIRMLTKQGFSAYAIKDPNGAFSLYVGVFYTQKGAEDQHAELLSKGIQSKIVER
ncbi:MAG: SPOR domain-containing protein, partial [Proteobacteria bacterium]|nr:SPOR domain-containing protein [Pseudomonadota bacterium]